MDNSTEDDGDYGNEEHEITGVSEVDKSDENKKIRKGKKENEKSTLF